jgi:hypothetical protein
VLPRAWLPAVDVIVRDKKDKKDKKVCGRSGHPAGDEE